MKYLYINVGIPGSGKTTISSSFAKILGIPVISRDEIRFGFLKENDDYFKYEKLVFQTFVSSIVKALKEGEGCIADATHISYASRNKLVSAIAKEIDLSEFQIQYNYFDIPLETCLARNALREGRECVPPETIEQMHKALEIPTIDEFRNVQSIFRHKE